MAENKNSKTIMIGIVRNGYAGNPVSVIRASVPEDIDEQTFLARLEWAKSKRQNAYDVSPEAALDLLRRKYGYGIEKIPVPVFIDASRSDWYAQSE